MISAGLMGVAMVAKKVLRWRMPAITGQVPSPVADCMAVAAIIPVATNGR